MRTTIALFLGLCLACQTGALHAPVFGTWGESVPNSYRFADKHLDVLLVVGADQSLSWEFKNHRRRTLEIRHEEMALCLIDESNQDIEKFSLWGTPTETAKKHPPLRVFPKSFTTIRYPVLFRSPLIPFENVRERVELRFFARWGNQITPYRLTFISRGKTP